MTRVADQKFGSVKRKIASIMKNFKVHFHVENLKWMELILFPLNTTSFT